MKTLILASSLFLGGSALATTIQLQPGNSITIKAGDTAIVSCAGTSSGSSSSVGNISAVCSGSNLVLQLDTVDESKSDSYALGSTAACSNTLGDLKPDLGSFEDLKILQFCSGSNLIRVRLSAINNSITSTSTAMGSSAACSNALN